MYDYKKWTAEKDRLDTAICELSNKMAYRELELGDTNRSMARNDIPQHDTDPLWNALSLQMGELKRRRDYLIRFGCFPERALRIDGFGQGGASDGE